MIMMILILEKYVPTTEIVCPRGEYMARVTRTTDPLNFVNCTVDYYE